MRLPFIQVTQEAWHLARMLAPLLEITRRDALGLVVDLWALGLQLGPSDEPPSGILAGPRADVMLAGALEWSGNAEALVGVLEGLALVERVVNGGIRIKGLDRYRPAFEKAKADRERKAKWREGQRASAPGPRDGAGKTQTQTQTQTQEEEKKGAAPASPRVKKGKGSLKDGRALAKPEEEAPTSQFRMMQAELVQTFADYVGGKYAWNGAKDSEALKRLMGVAGIGEIISRWRAGLRATGWNQVSTVAQLWSKWNDLSRVAPPEPEKPPAPEQPDTPAGKLWAEALDKMRGGLAPYGAQQMENFRAVELTDERLVLEAPDAYAVSWAEMHWHDLLPQAVGRPVELRPREGA